MLRNHVCSMLLAIFYSAKCLEFGYNGSSLLPYATASQSIGYDCFEDKLFLMGGAQTLFNTSVSFDLLSEQTALEKHEDLYIGSFASGFTQINDLLFIDTGIISGLTVYDLNTKTINDDYYQIEIPSLTHADSERCVTSFTNYLIVTGGTSGTIYNWDSYGIENVRNTTKEQGKSWCAYGCKLIYYNIRIYNILQDKWLENVPLMNDYRTKHTCTVNYNVEYLYNIGGLSGVWNGFVWRTTTVEKIYIGDMENIEKQESFTLNATLPTKRYDGIRSVSLGNKIFVLGGFLGGSRNPPLAREIEIIDTKHDTIFISEYYLSFGVINPATIVVDNTLYLFGGAFGEYDGYYRTYTDKWQYIDMLSEQSFDFCNFSDFLDIKLPHEPTDGDHAVTYSLVINYMFFLFAFCTIC